jgi:hypothetical protein
VGTVSCVAQTENGKHAVEISKHAVVIGVGVARTQIVRLRWVKGFLGYEGYWGY